MMTEGTPAWKRDGDGSQSADRWLAVFVRTTVRIRWVRGNSWIELTVA
jgi:hypothetical protein